MHQCLRCNQPHTETSLFCGYCQQTLLNRYQPKEQPGNRYSLFVREEVSYIREPKLLRLPIRSKYTSQMRQFKHEREKKQEPLPTSLETRPPRSLYKTIVQRRLRIAFILLLVLALVAFVIDGVLALEVITHKPHSTHKVSAVHTSPLVPPVIPIQVTPQQVSSIDKLADPCNTNPVDNTKKSQSSGSTLAGQLARSQGGGPALAVSSATLNFSLTPGQQSHSAQIITIVNTGAVSLDWLATSTAPTWLDLSAYKGSVAVGQGCQIQVSIDSAGLDPGTYDAQIAISATDSAGLAAQASPQIVVVRLKSQLAEICNCSRVAFDHQQWKGH